MDRFNLQEQLQACPESSRLNLRAAMLSFAVDSAVIRRINALQIDDQSQRNVISAGDPCLGTVVYIGQRHTNPIVRGLNAIEIARSQRQIFHTLVEENATIVLSERSAGKIGARVVAQQPDSNEFKQKLINYTDGSVFHTLSPRRQELVNGIFTEFDAATVYGMFAEESAGVYGFTDPSKIDETNAILLEKSHNFLGKKEDSVALEYRTMVQREGWLAETVLQYLERNPSSTVHVVFGAAHQFDAQDFISFGKTPRIERIDFVLPQRKMEFRDPLLSW